MSINVSNTPDMYKIYTSGRFTFNTKCRVRNTPDMSDPGIVTYQVGQSVNYDSKLKNGNHLWLSYMSNSGGRHYVPYANTDKETYFGTDTNPGNPIKPETVVVPGGNDGGSNVSTPHPGHLLGTLTGQTGADIADQTPDGTILVMKGSFTFDEPARGRDRTNMTTANKVDRFLENQTVYYNAKIKADGHYWFRYIHTSGATYYVPYATINPYRSYGTDANPGDPVLTQDNSGTSTGNVDNSSNNNESTGSSHFSRPQGGTDTGLLPLTSSDYRENIREGYHYPSRSTLTITSNAWGRDQPFMKSANKLHKYQAGTRIDYNYKLFNNGHLWVILRNGQYLPISTMDHLKSMQNGEKSNTSSYSYVQNDNAKMQPPEELWPYTKDLRHGVGDTSYLESNLLISDVSSSVEVTPTSTELAEMTTLAQNIKASADSQSVSIAYITDTHFDSYKTPSTARVLRNMKLMSYFAKHFGVDLVVHGGDLNDGVKPKSVSINEVKRGVDAIKLSQRPFIILQGNHDDNSGYARDEAHNNADQVITNSEALTLRRNWFGRWLNTPSNNPNNAVFGRYDVPNSNLTVLVLDGFDQPDYAAPTRTKLRHGHTEYSSAQQDWLRNTLSSLPDSQKIAVFDHISLTGIPVNQWAISDKNNSWFEHSPYASYQAGLATSRNIYDILTTHQEKQHNILGFFAGHTHMDNHALSGQIQFVTTTCALADRGDGSTSRSLNTLSENAWEIVQFNPTRNEVIRHRFGYQGPNFKKSWSI
ncbi:SH3 domain-containing protein [Levilactobacillus cerevisiae]|uniref:SH3 domain-containing protein n=1 Tax=Levilactobacillus cerevisiae TaxID=1704076 RepID=UPI000F768BEF|nr:SH3 domain-containing protein [Levilactobacillus cerevisiae]